jgi:Tfp pilus assembly protein PilF
MGKKHQPTAAPDDLHQHAAHLQQQGHYAAAALFYDYLGDHGLAMECYQHAVNAREQE